MKRRAYIVNRVSKEEQKEGYSLETQLKKCLLFCEQLEAEVVHVLSEAYSATTSKSLFAGLEPMFEAVEAGEVDLVIFYELDRVTRGGLGETTVIVDRIRKSGAQVGYAARMAMAGTTPDEKMMDGLRALFAEREWQITRERTMRGWKGKAERGIFVGNGVPPYGYDRVVDPNRGTTTGLTINEEQAGVVRRIFRWFVLGDESGQPMGVKAIAARLHLDGIPTPSTYHPGHERGRKRGPTEWGPTTVYNILRHSAYRGVAYAFKNKYIGMGSTQKSHLTRKRPEEEWIPTYIPAILSGDDEKLWEAAQVKLNEGKALSKRNTKHDDDYLMGRRLKCGCGYALHGSTHTNKGKDGETLTYHYYRCSAKVPLHVAGTCDLPNVRTDRLDNAIWSWVQMRLITPEEVAEDEAHVEAQRQNSSTHFDERIAAYAHDLDKLAEESRKVSWQHRKGLIDDDEFAEQKADINEERAAKQKAIDELEQKRLAARYHEEQRANIAELAAEYQELAQERADFTTKRTLVNALDLHVVVRKGDPGTLKADVYSIFAFDPQRDTLTIPLR